VSEVGRVEDTVHAAHPETFLQVTGLCVATARSGVPVIQDVSFQLERGRLLGLVGESGSGKSTVALAILGYARRGLRITSGSVIVDGRDVLTFPPRDLRRMRGKIVSYVPQDPGTALNPAIRVGRQLMETLTIHKGVLAVDESPEDRVRSLLGEVDLPVTDRFLHSFLHQLSGGQQQRVAIAMAFACRPRLIVLDEPTTGLDVTSQRHILETIRALTHRHQVAAVYVSHDLPVVAELADATAVMYAGRLVEKADGPAIFSDPRHPYTRGLIGAAPSPDRAARLIGISGYPPRPGQWPRGCKFADRCDVVLDACREQEPLLETTDDGRQLRCINSHPRNPAVVPDVVESAGNQRGASLSVSKLGAAYGNARILGDIGLEIAPGECLAVVGESGSGKTTLARCLAGLHSRWTGDVLLDGEPVGADGRKRPERQRRLIQYIFQNPYASLNPRMSVAENVGEPLRYFGDHPRAVQRAKALECLDLVALGRHFGDMMPGQLSGGERQRVAVARALAVDPELLICDEVTSALDVSVQAVLVEQLRALQRSQGLTMLFITHNLAVVRSIAQRVMVLERGRVVEVGTVDEVLNHPREPYTQQLIADLPRYGTPAAGLVGEDGRTR
jgi:peptide/nickel transport system ATP-binding protein